MTAIFTLSSLLLLAISCLLFLSYVRGNKENNRQHPALSDACVDFLDELRTHPPTAGQGGEGKKVQSAVVIMTVHNPNPTLLLQSIQSILSSQSPDSHEGREMITLKSIIIADQGSYPAIRTWNLWTSSSTTTALGNDYSHIVHHVYQPIGGSRADLQNAALASLSLKKGEEDQVMIVFMPLGLVTPNFLSPLAFALWRSPNALVYPSEDLLVYERDSEEVIRVLPGEEELVAGFDWQFRLRWEDPHSGRVRGGSSHEGKYELLSPSLPHAFAAVYSTLQLLGPFDSSTTSLEGDSELTAYSLVEYGLRAWLCGHSIVKARCAHLAIEQRNLLDSALSVGDHVSQGGIDRVVVQLSRKWLDRQAQEIVYQARFLGRLLPPQEMVSGLAVDPMEIGPVQSSPLFTESVERPQTTTASSTSPRLCTSFSWYSREVYPGLLEDQTMVRKAFTQYHVDKTEDSLHDNLQPLLDFHFPPSIVSQQDVLSSIFTDEEKKKNADDEEEGRLQRRRDLLHKHGWEVLQMTREGSMKSVFLIPPPIDPKANLQDALDDHSEHVRHDLLCEDLQYQDYCHMEIEKGLMKGKQGSTDNNNKNTLEVINQYCQREKFHLLFACPKSCGFCAEGKFCEDFYLLKCPKWAAAGQCDNEDVQVGKIRDVCRKSCQVCQPDYLKTPPQQQQQSDSIEEKEKAPAILPPIVKDGAMAGGEGLPIDETVAHQAFLAGQLPDNIVSSRTRHPGSPCAIKGSSDARLLDVIQKPLSTTNPPVRIFCGIYTISTAHEDNVRATRDTWGKRCDGFIAFSNLTDPSIPSLAIEHEGEESYQNMWQKSRSIWKTIYQHFRHRYDFFLLGGDDMFILIENLRQYLASPEIQSLHEESEHGLFLGRVFSPPKQLVFNSGGAGYVLDQKALQVLGENLDRPKCFPHQKGFWEDVNIANCLLVGGKVAPYDTRDGKGRERFHPFPPGHHLDYRPPPNGEDWYVKYSGDRLKLGFECCSQESVSFHYLKAKALYTLFDYYYNCPSRGQ